MNIEAYEECENTKWAKLDVKKIIAQIKAFWCSVENRQSLWLPQTVDKVPEKSGLFYIYNRFSGIIGLSERRCFL